MPSNAAGVPLPVIVRAMFRATISASAWARFPQLSLRALQGGSRVRKGADGVPETADV
jgi:hypothetical protein